MMGLGCQQLISKIDSNYNNINRELYYFMKEKSKGESNQKSQWQSIQKYDEWRPSMPNQCLKNRNSMRWSLKQNKIYCQFLKLHKEKFTDKIIRKKTRVYHMLSKRLRKRTALQVKSHHQKMIKRFQNIQNLIIQLQNILMMVETQSTTQNQKNSTQSITSQACEIKQEPQIAQTTFIMFKTDLELELGIQPNRRDQGEFDNPNWFGDE